MPTATKRRPAVAKRTAGGKAKPRRQSKPAPPAARSAAADVPAHVVLYDNGRVQTFDADGELIFASPGTVEVLERVGNEAPTGCRFTWQRWGQGAKGSRDLTREQFKLGFGIGQ